MSVKEPTYIRRIVTTVTYEHNPKFDGDALCICNHPYHRHFDSYDNNLAIGCKYCQCSKFGSTIEEWEENNQRKLFCKPDEVMHADIPSQIMTVDEFLSTMSVLREMHPDTLRYHYDAYPMKDGLVADLFHHTVWTREEDSKLPFVPDAYLVFKWPNQPR